MELQRQQAQELMEYYKNNYEIITFHILKTENIENKDKLFIGTKEERRCRFCGRGKGDTTFKKVAHAIPELIGNKIITSFEECDECNEIFSKLENELANYLSFVRPTTGIKGKKGVPSYKGKDGLQIDVDKEKKNRFILKNDINSGNIEEDVINKTITIKGEISPYIPLSVYKCFVKMGLSIMPKEYLKHFFYTLIWIREENFYPEVKCKLYEQFIPGVKPYTNLELYLLKRKDDSIGNIPFCIFVICFGNYCYQVYLPLATEDSKTDVTDKEEFIVHLFPSKYALSYADDPIKVFVKDFSSNKRVKGEKEEITYSYGKKEYGIR
ncbi:HNH endonuclease [Lysinibacillus xylanilyticus]|uniref:HNH endonuclease n=1 Tax=Lysinibacillus xylanilyticus TaxID=582475 RepID=UPI003820ACF4